MPSPFVTTLVDALVVIGGGIAAAHRLFLPSLVAEMNGRYTTPAGEPFRRLVQVVFDLEDPEQMETFLRGRTIDLTVPGSGRTVIVRRAAAARASACRASARATPSPSAPTRTP